MTRFARIHFPFAYILAVVTVTTTSADALAAPDSQVGTITRLEGDVVLLTNPSKSVEGEGPHVRYEGEYYGFRKAKEGDRVEYGNVVRTDPSAKAKIIYDNGDQYAVGEGTAFRVKWNRSPAAAAPAPELNLLHGKIRAIISKDGPRNRLNVRTKNATMGVRGTDFFIASHSGGKAVEVAVIRGSVEVKPKAVDAKPVKVEKGHTAALTVAPVTKVQASREVAQENTEATKPVAVIVEKTTKQELAVIQASSAVAQNRRRDLASENAKVDEKIENLEKKAVETTLKDIKTHDPDLYAKIDTKAVAKAEDLNAVVVTKAIEKAPAAPENRKPFGIDDGGEDVYKKYFNMD